MTGIVSFIIIPRRIKDDSSNILATQRYEVYKIQSPFKIAVVVKL